jgi:hypothetical protein
MSCDICCDNKRTEAIDKQIASECFGLVVCTRTRTSSVHGKFLKFPLAQIGRRGMPFESSRSVWFASQELCKHVILELHG